MKRTSGSIILAVLALTLSWGCGGSAVADRDGGGTGDDTSSFEVNFGPDSGGHDDAIQGECKTAADCLAILGDELDACHEPVCDTTGQRAVCVAVAKADGTSCDDGNACTSDDSCQAGQCTGTAVPGCVCDEAADCAPFEDGDPCNGTLHCVEGQCLVDAETIVVCDDAEDTVCRQNTCDPATGTCAPVAVANGTVCTGDDPECPAFTCQEGECVCGCVPQCEGRECGPDACGGNCGVCAGGQACEDGQCVACTPDCAGLQCGPDPICGSSCGECGEGFACQAGTCVEAGGPTCAAPAPLACGDALLGDTSTALNLLESYSCVQWPETGGEHVYRLMVPEDATVTITLSGLTEDLDLFVLDGACDGAACLAVSALTGDESLSFNALAGVEYFVVVDGYDGAASSYELAVTCGAPCVPDCTDLACGPDPLCGIECGPCGEDQVCLDGACMADPCASLPFEGCCDGATVVWCEEGEIFSIDCGLNGPPADTCGWNEDGGYFDCGGTDTLPEGLELECPWTCRPTQSCEQLGLACGPHPECPELSCGACELGTTCEQGVCVECTPDCGGRECGPDPVCGLPCGVCQEGYVCDGGMCVQAPLLSCANPGAVACGGAVSGDTTGATNDIDRYGACQSWQYAEPEHVHAFGPLEAPATVTATLTGLSVDLDLFVLTEACVGDSCLASSAEFDLADESLSFQAEAGVVYYLVIDGSGTGVGTYSLQVSCDAPCVPECGALQCGPDPVCGLSCGTCGEGLVCVDGFCLADPCDDLPPEGCCDGAVVTWCDAEGLQTIDCSLNDPPGDVCGWNAEAAYFDCGGLDPVPEGVVTDCPWACEPTESCEDLGFVCGPHPECPNLSCGACGEGTVCEAGACVTCVPECGERVCGPDPLCGLSCGTCDEGEVCQLGACVEAGAFSCAQPGALACGGSVQGDTSAGLNVLESYACTEFPETGPEQVYSFQLEVAAEVSLTLSGMTADLDLYVLGAECDGAACVEFSAGVADESVVFNAAAGATYYVVVDGFDGASDTYTLSMDCGAPCVPDCTNLACGPDPVCGLECGPCALGEVCNQGACLADPCDDLPFEGCCDGGVVAWCDTDGFHSADCSQNEAPFDVCGWSEEGGFFDCGGVDPVPEGVVTDCPWTCVPTQSCEALGLSCGAHPECPNRSCGTCEEGSVCEQGQCVACVPDCAGRECGPDPVCGSSCGTCASGFVCDEGACVEAVALSCANPGLVGCSGTVSGSTAEATNLVESYGACQPYQYDEPEHVHAFGPLEADATVTVTLTGLAVDLDLFVLAGACDGESCLASSAEFDLADELVSFQARAGVTYYFVIDGSGTGAGAYSLSVECGEPCVPDCSGIACGPDPVCGLDCGACDGGEVCYAGACLADPCGELTDVGCCDGGIVAWCDANGFQTLDCGGNEPPADLCGYNAEAGFFDCGGVDELPEGLSADCPWACQPTESCDALGLACGPHPECPNRSCGTCEEGSVCEQGQCVACVPDCAELACGPDPVCGQSCGECEAGFVCQDGACVDAGTLTCAMPGALACGESLSADTTGALNLIELYPACTGYTENGGEHIYQFVLPEETDVTIELTGLAADLDLYLLGEPCGGESCLAGSAGTTDERIQARLSAGTYFVSVDGFNGAASAYDLALACAPPCVPDCDGLSCGPDPVCGESCGECEEGFVCEAGACLPDPCEAMPFVGCCDGSSVSWCEEGVLQTVDCGLNEPPADTCGWNAESAFFDCGGVDPVPDGVTADCPWLCVPSQDCAELGLSCGAHPECPALSCGACGEGLVCDEGICVEGQGSTCAEPAPLACGEVLVGSNAGAANAINDYTCVGWPETGGEQVYLLIPDSDAQVTLTLTGLAADLDLFVLEDLCDGQACVAASASVGDEEIVLNVLAGSSYYVVVDGYQGAVSDYVLSVSCEAPCVPDCAELACGPDPVCGLECGPCAEGLVCNVGACIDDPCAEMAPEGCCDGGVVAWCEEGQFFSIDCGLNEAPNDICGYDAELGYFDCGATDEPPAGLALECPWACVPTQSCEELGLACGAHPECPALSCGECDDGAVCQEGACVLAEAMSCLLPGPLACGATVQGDTTGAASNLLTYPNCVSFSETGPEHVHEFIPAEDAQVTVTLSDLGVDLDLFVLAGDCAGEACVASSAGVTDESLTFEATAGSVYYVVVDGYSAAAGAYTLGLTCGAACVPDCAGLACGPDPVCGASCGECGDGEACVTGLCVADPCLSLDEVGCCDGSLLAWCEEGQFYTIDCGENEPPNDLCGYSAEPEFFDCGGVDEPPAGVSPDCPF